MVSRNVEKMRETIESMPRQGHRYYQKDLSETGNYKQLLDEIIEDGHKIDGLVYCAGMAKILPISMLSKNTMDESMSTNLYSFVEIN